MGLPLLLSNKDIAHCLEIIAARAAEIETERRLPADIVQAMTSAGLFRITLPRRFGGLELPPIAFIDAIEQVAEADASAAWCVMIGGTTALAAAYMDPDAAAAIWSGPDVVTGGVFAPLGRAVLEDGHYRVTGRWPWGSGNGHCAWLAGGCFVTEGGIIRTLPGGMPDGRMIFFPASAVERIDTWHVAGLAGTGSGDLVITDQRTPEAFSVPLSFDRPREPGPLYAFPLFGLLALGIAAVALGNARGSMAALKSLVAEKKPMGARRTVSERPATQMAFAMAEARLRAARSFLREAVAEAWEAANAKGEISLRLKGALRLAACYATTEAADVALEMYSAGGGTAVFASHPLQRRMRDAQVAKQHVMVQPAMVETVGRILLGLDVDAAML